MSNGTDVQWGDVAPDALVVREVEWFPSTWTPADVSQQDSDWREVFNLPDPPYDPLTEELVPGYQILAARINNHKEVVPLNQADQDEAAQRLADQIEREECWVILDDPTPMTMAQLDKVLRQTASDVWGRQNVNTQI